MQDLGRLTEIGHVIQLAVAPVFLLSGVGAMLGVLTNRLARIIDRGRSLEAGLPRAADASAPAMRSELGVLSARARLINWAISLCTVCALLVCAVIVALFLGPFLRLDLSAVVAWVFIAAMIALCSALVSFLREIFVATRHLRIGAS
jgi:Protein of unknown function (DUF2721)